MDSLIIQNLAYFAFGYTACYLKNKYNITNEYIVSQSIDLYVDGKYIIKSILNIQKQSKQSKQSNKFWENIKTIRINNGYKTTYKKNNKWYHVIHDDKTVDLSENQALSDLEVVSINSECPLTKDEEQLVKLLVAQWSGYSGDFHNNEIYLENITGLSDIIESRKIHHIIVNTNLITETTIGHME